MYFHFFAVPASGLSNLKVYIPDTVLRGHNIQFNCTFTLEDEKLFAIKWYRGNYEIFRYLPSSDVPMKTFPLEGYNVSVSIYYTAVFYQVRIYLFVKMSILDGASFLVIIFVESTREEIRESFVKGSGLENERISFLHKGSEQGLETSSLWK